MIAWIFAIVIIAIVGKLMYDVQQKKNKINEINETALTEAEKFREQWQNLAGIGTTKPVHNTELLKELADKWSKDGFPESDPSLPMGATKITTIDTNFGSDNDPLASVPMSRVSKQAKQKIIWKTNCSWATCPGPQPNPTSALTSPKAAKWSPWKS